MGLFKKVLGKEKPVDAEAPPAADAALEEENSEAGEAAVGGVAEGSDNGHGTLDPELPEWQSHADELGEKGQAELENGEVAEAVLHLLEALKLYEAHEKEKDALRISQYLGIALYDSGRQNEAVSVWEEIVSRGCEDKPVYERLIEHYEGLERNDDVARVRLLLDSIVH